MAKLLSIKYRDVAGVTGTFAMYIDVAYAADDSETIALVQAFRNLTNAHVEEAVVHEEIDISGLTNGAAGGTGTESRTRSQVILQLRRTDGTGFVSVTVPAPLDTILQQTGVYRLQAVDDADSLVAAWIAAAITEPILVSPQGGALAYSKGWVKGQPHP